MKWVWLSIATLLVVFIGIGVYGYNQWNSKTIPPKSELWELEGYLSYTDGWIFFELKDAELVNGKLRVINEENLIVISFDQNTSTKFNPGDRVRVWVDGILESVPRRMSPYYIELVQ